MLSEINLTKRIIAKFLDTVFLLAIVAGSGVRAQNLTVENIALVALVNAIATGVGLIALILMFGNLSGAHFNPVLIL
jgi:glycerol uptake facilitator-like aquaporin